MLEVLALALALAVAVVLVPVVGPQRRHPHRRPCPRVQPPRPHHPRLLSANLADAIAPHHKPLPPAPRQVPATSASARLQVPAAAASS